MYLVDINDKLLIIDQINIFFVNKLKIGKVPKIKETNYEYLKNFNILKILCSKTLLYPTVSYRERLVQF